MKAQTLQPCVAVFDSDPWLVRILRATLQAEGYRTVAPQPEAYGWNREELARFLKTCCPHAVVYDVPFPCEESWQQIEQLRRGPEGKNIPFILTTTNRAKLARLVPHEDGMQIVEKPFELDDLLSAVKHALAPEPAVR